jgi:hypothetical protein
MLRNRCALGDDRANEGSVELVEEKTLLQPAGDRLLRGLRRTEKEVVPT